MGKGTVSLRHFMGFVTFTYSGACFVKSVNQFRCKLIRKRFTRTITRRG